MPDEYGKEEYISMTKGNRTSRFVRKNKNGGKSWAKK